MEQVIFDFIRLEDDIVEEICRDIPVNTFSEKLSVAKEMNYNCRCSCKTKKFLTHRRKQENSIVTSIDSGTVLSSTGSVSPKSNMALNVNNSYGAKEFFNQMSSQNTVELSTSNEDGSNCDTETRFETRPFHLSKNYYGPSTYLSSPGNQSKDVQHLPVKLALSEMVKQNFVDEDETCIGTIVDSKPTYDLKYTSNTSPGCQVGEINCTEHHKFMPGISDDLWGYKIKGRNTSPSSSSTSGVDEDFDFDTECSKANFEDACSCTSSVHSEHNAIYNSNANYLYLPSQKKYKNNVFNNSVYMDSKYSGLSDEVALCASNEQSPLSTVNSFTTTPGQNASWKADHIVDIGGRSFSEYEQVNNKSLYNHIPSITNRTRNIENGQNRCLNRQSEENTAKDNLTTGKADMYNDCYNKMKFGSKKLDESDGRHDKNSNKNKIISGDSTRFVTSDSQLVQSFKPVLQPVDNNFSYILNESKEKKGSDNVKINIDMIYDIDFPLLEDGRLDFTKMNLCTESSNTIRVKLRIPKYLHKSEHSEELGQHVMKCLMNQLESNSEKLLSNKEESALSNDTIESVTEYYV